MNSNIDKKKILFFSKEDLDVLFSLFPVSLIAKLGNKSKYIFNILLALVFYKENLSNKLIFLIN